MVMNASRSLFTALVLLAGAGVRAQVPDFHTNWIGWDTSTGS